MDNKKESLTGEDEEVVWVIQQTTQLCAKLPSSLGETTRHLFGRPVKREWDALVKLLQVVGVELNGSVRADV